MIGPSRFFYPNVISFLKHYNETKPEVYLF